MALCTSYVSVLLCSVVFFIKPSRNLCILEKMNRGSTLSRLLRLLSVCRRTDYSMRESYEGKPNLRTKMGRKNVVLFEGRKRRKERQGGQPDPRPVCNPALGVRDYGIERKREREIKGGATITG